LATIKYEVLKHNMSAADPRNIMRFGVLYNATYIVTVHNHVSGKVVGILILLVKRPDALKLHRVASA